MRLALWELRGTANGRSMQWLVMADSEMGAYNKALRWTRRHHKEFTEILFLTAVVSSGVKMIEVVGDNP